MARPVISAGLSLLAGVLMFVALLLLSSHEVSGRAQYSKAFFETYPDNAAAKVLMGNARCTVCHPGVAKKMRNNYGEAYGKLLGMKNEMDQTKIKDALKKVEGEQSATAGKTFGDLLKDGKLPGK